jgi:ribonuclease HI
MANYLIHFDGSCWPNPGGVAAYGYTVDKEGVEIAAVAGLVPSTLVPTSNNVAEFYALYAALRAVMQDATEPVGKIEVRGDSQLVINVMDRKWRTNPEKLYFTAYALADELREMLEFEDTEFTYNWIPREANTRCDDLSKEINNAKM